MTARVSFLCEQCVEPFWRFRSEVSRATRGGYSVRFCTRKCRNEWQKEDPKFLTHLKSIGNRTPPPPLVGPRDAEMCEKISIGRRLQIERDQDRFRNIWLRLVA